MGSGESKAGSILGILSQLKSGNNKDEAFNNS
jgi:hypothetical protein